MTVDISDALPPAAQGPESLLQTAADASGQNLAAAQVAPASHEPVRPLLTIRATSGWATVNLAEIWHFRNLLFTLGERDIRLRYRQTALGVAWVVLQPLMAAGVLSFVFGSVAKFPSPIPGTPYFLFAFAGQLAWNFFAGTLSKTSGSMVGNAHLISKVYFPRLVLPLSGIYSTVVDFSVAAALMAVLMGVFHCAPNVMLLLLPFWLILLLSAALGIGLVAASLTVSYRDVQYVLPVFLQLLMYASPVAYAVSAIPQRVRFAYYINPMTGLLEAFRWSILGGDAPHAGLLIYSAIFAIVALIVGAISFRHMERKFVDII